MGLLFGQFADLVGEIQSLAKVLELVFLFQVVLVDGFGNVRQLTASYVIDRAPASGGSASAPTSALLALSSSRNISRLWSR
jgi:hypothetical protein